MPRGSVTSKVFLGILTLLFWVCIKLIVPTRNYVIREHDEFWQILRLFGNNCFFRQIEMQWHRLSTENLFNLFFDGETFLTFLFFWKTFLNLFVDEKNFFFQDFCGKCIKFCFVLFFLGKFLSAHHVLNWAGLSAWLYLLSGDRNSAPSCACREMSQRLTRPPSNCGKS